MPYKDPIKRDEYNKEYRQSEIGKMNVKISQWKKLGLICEHDDEYEYVYDRWWRSEQCEEPKCNTKYSEGNKKCMDHCHDTGLFRNIICNSCNTKRRTKENSSGTTHIYKHGKYNTWVYRITINKRLYQKQSRDLEWLKKYKKEFEKKYLYNN